MCLADSYSLMCVAMFFTLIILLHILTVQTGRVTKKDFVAIATPFLLHNTPAGALQEMSNTMSSAGVGADSSAALTLAPTEDLSQLQGFLR